MFLPKKTRVEYALEIPDKGFENIKNKSHGVKFFSRNPTYTSKRWE